MSSLRRDVASDTGCCNSRCFHDKQSDQHTVCTYPDNLYRFQGHIELTFNFRAPIDSYFVIAYLTTGGYGERYLKEGSAHALYAAAQAANC
jgi:hypothetical protein